MAHVRKFMGCFPLHVDRESGCCRRGVEPPLERDRRDNESGGRAGSRKTINFVRNRLKSHNVFNTNKIKFKKTGPPASAGGPVRGSVVRA